MSGAIQLFVAGNGNSDVPSLKLLLAEDSQGLLQETQSIFTDLIPAIFIFTLVLGVSASIFFGCIYAWDKMFQRCRFPARYQRLSHVFLTVIFGFVSVTLAFGAVGLDLAGFVFGSGMAAAVLIGVGIVYCGDWSAGITTQLSELEAGTVIKLAPPGTPIVGRVKEIGWNSTTIQLEAGDEYELVYVPNSVFKNSNLYLGGGGGGGQRARRPPSKNLVDAAKVAPPQIRF